MIFLDVGAHDGQTLEEVTKPTYDFSAIYAFEPMPAQYANLAARYGDLSTVMLLNCGLYSGTGVLPLYGDNDQMEASIFPKKFDVDASVVTKCDFVSASGFFRTLPGSEKVIVKLNCEGAEIPILDDLLDSREIARVANVMIDFDIRKVRGQQREEERILQRFETAGFKDFVLSEEVMVGETHQDRIAAWLAGVLS